MNALHRHENISGNTLEYPLFEGERNDIELINAFTENLVREIKKGADDPVLLKNNLKYRLSYRKKQEDGRVVLIFVIELISRRRAVRRKEISTVWSDGFLESCDEISLL